MGLFDYVKRLFSCGPDLRSRAHPAPKQGLSVASVAEHIRTYHAALCQTFLKLLVPGSPDLRDIEVTDQFLLDLSERTYVIQLACVYMAAKNQLGTLPRCRSLILQAHRCIVEHASSSLHGIQGSGRSDRDKYLASIIPSALTGLSQAEVAKLAPFCAAVAILGFDDDLLASMSAPLRAFTEYSEAIVGEDRQVAFRLAALSFYMAFSGLIAKSDEGKWAAVIDAYWVAWLNAWEHVLAEHTEFVWDVPICGV